jgi:hypothetical protein
VFLILDKEVNLAQLDEIDSEIESFMLQQGSEQFFPPKKSLIYIIGGMKQGILTGNLLDIDKYFFFLFKVSYFYVLKIFLKKNNLFIYFSLLQINCF